jgi:hypothetical protein
LKTVLKPKTEWDTWKEELVVAAKRTFQPMDGSYRPKELSEPATRIGADDHDQHPSRRGNTLRYRDGREERIDQ